MKYLPYTILITILLVSTSCRKVSNRPLDINLIPTTGTILDKIVFIDTVNNRIDQLIQYEYDDQMRITHIRDTMFATYNDSIQVSDDLYEYMNTDTVPVRRISTSPMQPVIVDTMFLEYDSENVIVKDSTRSYGNGALRTLTSHTCRKILSDTYYEERAEYNVNNGQRYITSKEVFNMTVVGGNLITEYDSILALPFGLPWEVLKINCNYDNHPNPFRRIALRHPYYKVWSDEIYSFFQSQTANNITSYTKQSYNEFHPSITNSSLVTIAYTYNSEGYPSSISASFSDPSDRGKTLLFYRYP